MRPTMAGKAQLETSNENTSSGFKVEGDLGGLQIEEVSDSDGESDKNRTNSSKDICPRSLAPSLPSGLIQTSTTPVFGSVAVTNSDNVHFGNNTFFNGPVTIKQVVQNKSGLENASYVRSEEDEPYQRPKTNKTNPEPTKKYYQKLRKWHIIAIVTVCAIIVGITCAILLSNSVSADVVVTGGVSKNHNIELVEGSCNSSIHLMTIHNFLILLVLPLIPMAYKFLLKEAWDVYNNFFNMIKMEDEQLLIAAEHLRIVPREDWLAQPVEKPLDKIIQPIPWVIIAHTAGYGCTTQSECVRRVRLIQQYHVESNKWDDIGYNFLVGGDGSVYLGRGWDKIGAHTLGYNKYSIGIAFIGTFKNESPPKQQVEACQKLIRLGVKLGKLRPDYKLFAHSQLMSTISPGDKVLELMMHWPNFVKNTSDVASLVPNYSKS